MTAKGVPSPPPQEESLTLKDESTESRGEPGKSEWCQNGPGPKLAKKKFPLRRRRSLLAAQRGAPPLCKLWMQERFGTKKKETLFRENGARISDSCRVVEVSQV